MFTTVDHEMSGLDVGVRAFRPAAPSPQGDESPLTTEEINTFREHLQHLRDWLLQSISQIESQAGRSAARVRAAFLNPEADDGAWEQTLAQQTMANKRLLLNEVMQAFERIRQNSYGRCIADNSCLSRKLLEELPWAKYCPACACRHV